MSFVCDAPEEWKKDEWFTSRSPVGIIAIYGQNQPVAITGEVAEQETQRWTESRNFAKAKWFSYAAATHYEYVLCILIGAGGLIIKP